MEITIRRVQPGDEHTLAYIQTESWKAAFRSILAPDVLARCTEIGRAEDMYRRLLAENKGNGYLLFLDGAPHCIAWWDAARDADMEGYAELICIHSLPQNWRRGCGTRMMARCLGDMKAAGYGRVMLWVFAENERARRFYEANGFSATAKHKEIKGVTEICCVRSL